MLIENYKVGPNVIPQPGTGKQQRVKFANTETTNKKKRYGRHTQAGKISREERQIRDAEKSSREEKKGRRIRDEEQSSDA